MKKAVSQLLERFGYRVEKRSRIPRARLRRTDATNVQDLVAPTASIRGMLSEESGKLLYSLCYLQDMPGDVVEIGSWQRYSTAFLGSAVRDSGNGTLYAIYHFRGNVGKKSRYIVEEEDLCDLQERFVANMSGLGLWDDRVLLAKPGEEATKAWRGSSSAFRLSTGIIRSMESSETFASSFCFSFLVPLSSSTTSWAISPVWSRPATNSWHARTSIAPSRSRKRS